MERQKKEKIKNPNTLLSLQRSFFFPFDLLVRFHSKDVPLRQQKNKNYHHQNETQRQEEKAFTLVKVSSFLEILYRSVFRNHRFPGQFIFFPQY